MSNLELHGPGGTIQTVKLPKSGSLLIGSDAVCDVQILDPDVQPIHARLKIQSGKNLVEATPEGNQSRSTVSELLKALLAKATNWFSASFPYILLKLP